MKITMAEELLELQILTEKKYVFIFSHIGPAILLDWREKSQKWLTGYGSASEKILNCSKKLQRDR